MRGARRRPLKMWTVVQRANLHELEALVDLAAALGFSNQVFALELADFAVPRWHEINAAASAEHDLDVNVLLGLVERGKERGVRVRFWNTTSKYSTESPEALCPWQFERLYLLGRARGAVLLHRQSGCRRDQNVGGETHRLVRPRFSGVPTSASRREHP